MVRRGLGIFISLAIALSAFPALASTAGSKCPTSDKKTSSAGATLICKKNSKGKLVWTKITSSPAKPATPPTTPPVKVLEPWEITEGILNAAWSKKAPVDNKIKIEYQPRLDLPPWAVQAIDTVEPSLQFFASIGVPVVSETALVVGEFAFVSKRTKELGCRNIGENEVSDNCAPKVLFLNTTPTAFMHNRESVLIHEAFHQAQTDAAEKYGLTRYHYPGWLRQGGAEVMRNFVFGKLTGRGYKAMREFQATHSEQGCSTFSLQNNVAQGRLTNASPTCDYTGGFFTVERLIALEKNPRALVTWVERTDVPLKLYTLEITPYYSMPALTLDSYLAAVEKIYNKPTSTFESEMETYARGLIRTG